VSLGHEEDPRELPAYRVAEAAAYLQIPVSTLSSWVLGRPYATQRGPRRWKAIIELPDPSERALSFINLVEAHVLASIRRRHNVGFSAIRRALTFLREELPSPHPLADREFETDGADLLIQAFERTINASQDGQVVMRDMIEQYLKRIDRDPAGLAAKLYPFPGRAVTPDKPIVIDPWVSFGRPILSGTGVRTSAIGDRFQGGDTVEVLSDDYGLSSTQVQEAIRWELQLRAAAQYPDVFPR
jgi:uncharacterized protein (DUF433 family)